MARRTCLKHVIRFEVPRNRTNSHVLELCIFSKGGDLKYSLRQPIEWKFSSCFLHLSQWKHSNLSAWFRINCSTHVVVVDSGDAASMKVESLGSLNSHILAVLDLLRWTNGRTCTRLLGDWTRVESIMVWGEKETCVRRLNVELRYVSSRFFHTITWYQERRK